ncbi:MAG: DegT/DnrJ/EryC1/StrS family aminotransferase [Acidimicrobiia bacterium]|nr:DegT/DnrJ/EryC1/StrS family aminotransferase [bacterium]MXX64168.1 DegT/DnrJ/EryC1/StrS family aminotransferase [Acidimicrobiia bacterium]MXZ06584.1 DegT/DnrJ/EryC1/StrS family aminotransferase [Acidimicrobiia bacterium]MYD05321.1 DegT/DnrJ/EryC1/StrS family aminotransferase [Acidimicrobiia bacterium]
MPGPGSELIGDAELAEIKEVLAGGYLARYGPPDGFPAKVLAFEQEVIRRSGVRHALAVNSGTSALWLALAGLGVGPGDEVIVPGFTFVASISSIVYSGALPVLAEVDQSFNLDPDDVETRITPSTKAVLVVHMLGSPARLKELREVADRHGVSLIEDAAQAFGGTYEGAWLGAHGDAGVFSFNIYKTITSGDGGMLVTDDPDLYRRCFALHDQGHSPNRTGVEVGKRPMLGLNFRMVELQGAVLLAQLGRLDRIRSHLRRNHRIVYEALADLPGIGFRDCPDTDGDLATHLVVVFPTPEIAQRVAAELGSITLSESGWHVYSKMEHLLEGRIAGGHGFPFGRGRGRGESEYNAGMLPDTDALLARSMSIGIGVVDPNLAPLGLGMSAGPEQAEQLAGRIRTVMTRHL